MNKELLLMKKSLLIALLIICSIVSAQEKKIDFRTADLKYLNSSQMREYQRWREDQFRMMKSSGLQSEVKSLVIQGNKIRSIIYNTGAISNPGVQGNVLDLVWNGLGYGYEFGPLVGARVPKSDSPGDSVNIVIDGFGGSSRSTADGDFAPDGVTKWGWLPKAGYSASGQNDLASWGARGTDLRFKPTSWPESWYNAVLGEYIYPSFLGGNSTVPDEEVYYAVDDATDKEFSYFPVPGDSSIGGLGLNLEVRTFQFSNPLAEDIIFLVYTAENYSTKTLNNVFFGMFGDPHVGGPSNYADDAASFVPAKAIGSPDFDKLIVINNDTITQRARNMVYTWDPDNSSDIPGRAPGYFGYKFLESPNNSTDNIDNDDDGITDEDPFNDKGTYIDGIGANNVNNGISDIAKYTALYGAPKPRWSGDEDGDWDITRDDIGVDGIAGTGDFGEGNGWPDQLIGADGTWLGSEPNFGFRDVNESDQIGLRSFWSLTFGGNNRPKNDNLMYNSISSMMDTAALALLYTTNPENLGDYVFLYGSGPFNMHQGHRERFSIALLMGSDLRDLILNSETAQLVLEANYRFAQPPPKPNVTAVAGDGKVTLYWDTNAENGLDPLTNQNDFEGYKIYRSKDYTFKDVFNISDGFGSPFLGTALYDAQAQKAAQWHRPWTAAEKAIYVGGFHPSEYRGRYIKYYMGEPNDATGLRHEYVDSTVTNGVTYYYAVVSFDHGEITRGLPPSESQSTITRDAVTQAFKFDVNTVAVVPNTASKGFVSSKQELQNGMTLMHTKGYSTAKLDFKVLDELNMKNASYKMSFAKAKVGTDSIVAYSIQKKSITVEQFIGNETLFVSLQNRNVVVNSVRIFNGKDTMAAIIPSASLVIDSTGGRVRANALGTLLKTKTYTVAYRYYPVAHSGFYKADDSNPVFDGIRVYAIDDSLMVDQTNSGFQQISGFVNVSHTVLKTFASLPYKLSPHDIRLTFTTTLADTDITGSYTSPADSILATNGTTWVKVPFKIKNINDTTNYTFRIVEKGNTVKIPRKVGRWDYGEEILLIVPPTANTVFTNILINKTVDSLPSFIPVGTEFYMRTRKPFAVSDEYEFSSKAATYNAQLGDDALQDVYVVPNPYVITSSFELPSNRPDLRGERVLQFRNLPRECTVRIYTITGELVQTLRKNDNTASLNWDLLSSESARIGYGIYIYHIETPSGATKIGRLGIIK